MSHMSVLVCACPDDRISNCVTAVLWLNSSVLEQQTKTKQSNNKSQSGHIVLFAPFHLFNLIHVLVQVTHTKLILYSTHQPFLHYFWHVLSFVCDWIEILMLNITPCVNGYCKKVNQWYRTLQLSGKVYQHFCLTCLMKTHSLSCMVYFDLELTCMYDLQLMENANFCFDKKHSFYTGSFFTLLCDHFGLKCCMQVWYWQKFYFILCSVRMLK